MFTTQHKTIAHFGLIVFLFKTLNVFNFNTHGGVPIKEKIVHSFAEQIIGLVSLW